MLWKPMGDNTIYYNLNHIERTKLWDREGKGNFITFICVNEHLRNLFKRIKSMQKLASIYKKIQKPIFVTEYKRLPHEYLVAAIKQK